jgi:hypothetical protein
MDAATLATVNSRHWPALECAAGLLVSMSDDIELGWLKVNHALLQAVLNVASLRRLV